LEDTTIEDVLKTVEALHNQKDYEGALRTLEGNQGNISPGLWHYNVGTVLAKMDQLPLARYHFLMAEREGFSTKELFQNKDIVENKLEIAKLEKPVGTSDYLYKGSLIASQGILTFLSLVVIIIAIIANKKKAGLKIFFGLLVTAGIFLGVNYWIQSWTKMIVITERPVHEGPSAIFEAREEIPSGIMLIVEREGEWIQVKYPSRYSGWIKDSGLKELK
jgi:hypothetical protein